MMRIVFLFFFFSGFSALIFEVAWVRELSLALGNTAQATSTVLAVFLGGLSIGAFFGGRLADKLQRNLLASYGYLEISVGVAALLLTRLLHHTGDLYVFLYHNAPQSAFVIGSLRFVVSSLLILVPTLLMGATLPVLVRYLAQFKQSSRLFSLLYGMNTFGAAAGSLFACFLGFAYLGLDGTLLCASSINIVIGLLAVYVERQAKAQSGPAAADALTSSNAGSESTSTTLSAEAVSPASSNSAPSATSFCEALAPEISVRMLCFLSFLTGFSSLSYEVLWTRLMRRYLTSLTYSSTRMISTFLLGLGIGSMVHEFLLSGEKLRKTNSYLIFSLVQYASAFFCALSIFTLAFGQSTLEAWAKAASSFINTSAQGTWEQIVYAGVVSAVVILPAAIFIGITFPLLGTIAASRREAAGAVGEVYAINTIGCVAGSLICGLVLMPTIGSVSAFQYTVLLSTITGGIAACGIKNMPRLGKIALVAVPLIAATYYLGMHFHYKEAAGCTILAEAEDTTGTMRVIDVPASKGIVLELNGSSLAGSAPANLRYMRLLAHLPMLLHKKPEKVMVACFGTGSTAGSLSIYPELKHLDIVELSKMVIGAAPFFKKTNYDVLNNPKVEVHINDARNFLLTNEGLYDVITFEPPPPLEAGIVNLYTEEFYQLLDKRLKDDGLVCQWVPMHQVSKPIWKMMVASARSVFPYVSIWLPDCSEAILLASKQPINTNFAAMQKRIDDAPLVKSSMKEVGFDNAMGVASTFVAGGASLDEFIKDSYAVTDNYPRLEFFLPYSAPLLGEVELEQAGAQSFKDFVAANQHSAGFNESEFVKNFQAIHLIREVENTSGPAEGDKLIAKALVLMPDNAWFKHISSRPQVVYPNLHATRIH